jgi:hypothetical protein
MFFVFTGAGLMDGAGYRSGSRHKQRDYGSGNGSAHPTYELGTKINQQPTKKTRQILNSCFIKKLIHLVKKLLIILDLLAPEEGEDTHLPENLTVEMGMRLLEEEEGETEMDTAPEGSVAKETTAPTTGPATDGAAATAAADPPAAAAAAQAATAAHAAAAAAKLRASQALSDKLVERAAQEAAAKKEQKEKEEAALAAYMAAERKEKDIWSRRGSNDSCEYGRFSSNYNSDMPPLYFTTKNKRENAIKTRILGGGGGSSC